MRIPGVSLIVTVAFIAACGPRPLPTARVAPIFGPAVGRDTISGHVVDDRGTVYLMVGASTLVSIDLESRTQRTDVIRLPSTERCWGLARLSDGSLWTLMGMNAVIQIGPGAAVAREVSLPVAHLGVFGARDRLILQRGSLPAGEPVLYSGTPGAAIQLPWSEMTARPFETLAMGAAAALNLVSCGTTRSGEIPCWFPDEPAVFLITGDGRTRRLTLDGLPHAAPEVLINARTPQRPVRDVFVEKDGTMWVLSTGTRLPEGKDLPGGWLLARYGRRGESIDRRLLPEPARLILRAAGGRALVLTGSGMVAEVQP